MPAVHLVALCHGLWGEPEHTAYLARSLAKRWGGTLSPASAVPESTSASASGSATPLDNASGISTPPDVSNGYGTQDAGNGEGKPSLVVLNTASNRWLNTYDGIDWCAERVVREVSYVFWTMRGSLHVLASIRGTSQGLGIADRQVVVDAFRDEQRYEGYFVLDRRTASFRRLDNPNTDSSAFRIDPRRSPPSARSRKRNSDALQHRRILSWRLNRAIRHRTLTFSRFLRWLSGSCPRSRCGPNRHGETETC